LIWPSEASGKYFLTVNSCWAILEIQPTGDIQEISRVRRSLIRQWHPDTVEDPAKKEEYTIRCATINAAYDEAVKIAEIRERVMRASTASPLSDVDVAAALRKDRPRRFHSDTAIKLFSPISAAIFFVYFLMFRVTFPATAMAIVFFAGAILAAGLDLIVYRYGVHPLLTFFGKQDRAVLPWALLELVNVGVLRRWIGDADLLFQAGMLLAIPIWRTWRWAQALRRSPDPSGIW
jgi:hypothetical protein